MEQSVEIVPEFGSSALRSSLFVIFASCCKYKFDFCKVKSVLASENDIFLDRRRRRRGRPAMGRSVDSLEAQKLKRTEWSGLRNPVWLTIKIRPPTVEKLVKGYLTYSLLLPVVHRSMETAARHLDLFWASFSSSLQV